MRTFPSNFEHQILNDLIVSSILKNANYTEKNSMTLFSSHNFKFRVLKFCVKM